MAHQFKDRAHAGQLLAKKLTPYGGRADAVVVALPRGGVPVAFEIAKALALPLDLFMVRNIEVPNHPELVMAAVTADGAYQVNPDFLDAAGLSMDRFFANLENEREEARRRELAYRNGRPSQNLRNKIVILVDDGLAAPATLSLAVDAIRSRGAATVVVAVPVFGRATAERFEGIADDFVTVSTQESQPAAAAQYATLAGVNDFDVCRLLDKAATRRHAA